jgi:hypothetical protein
VSFVLDASLTMAWCFESEALLAHALTKEDVVPDADINRAVERKKRYELNPEKHTHEESLDEQT